MSTVYKLNGKIMLLMLLMNCFTDLNKFDSKEFTVGTTWQSVGNL
jgi:hypothetical protein